MKKIVSGKDLEEKMVEAIDLLCNTVKSTLGPKGNNVIIDHSSFSPFITNDGVTIAQNIESEDEVLCAIIEIAKEASIKTNEVVGDGTTTTLVLLQALIHTSLKYIHEGWSPIVLKKELNRTLPTLISSLEKMAVSPTDSMLSSIAKVSANEEELGNFVHSIFNLVENKAAITIEEVNEDKMQFSLNKGYSFPIVLPSPYLLKEQKEIILKNSYILLINDSLNDIESISMVLNEVMEKNKSLVIIANEFDPYLVNEIVSLQLNHHLDCCLLKIEEYGVRQREILKDLEKISNAILVENSSSIKSQDMGVVLHITINKERAIVDFEVNEQIKKHISKLENESKEVKDSFDQEFYEKRIAMFTTGLVTIFVGGPTKTETRERRMRLLDAICAVSVSKRGVLPGSGVSILQISSELKGDDMANKIWREVLKKPFEQILLNAGLSTDSIQKEIEKRGYNVLYNVATDTYEEIKKSSILDPLEVVIHSLINSCSIATMLLTTTSIIINECKNNLNKVNDYTEVL